MYIVVMHPKADSAHVVRQEASTEGLAKKWMVVARASNWVVVRFVAEGIL